MLTKSDIQLIKDIFKNSATKDDLKNFATKDDLQQELKPIKQDVSKIRKEMKTLFNFLDKDFVCLRKKVNRVEEHLNLPPLP